MNRTNKKNFFLQLIWFSFFCWSTSTNLSAQGWEQIHGVSRRASKAITTLDNSYLVSGTSQETIGRYIYKLSSNGEIVWEREGLDMAQAPDGNYILWTPARELVNGANYNRPQFQKISPQGDVLWESDLFFAGLDFEFHLRREEFFVDSNGEITFFVYEEEQQYMGKIDENGQSIFAIELPLQIGNSRYSKNEEGGFYAMIDIYPSNESLIIYEVSTDGMVTDSLEYPEIDRATAFFIPGTNDFVRVAATTSTQPVQIRHDEFGTIISTDTLYDSAVTIISVEPLEDGLVISGWARETSNDPYEAVIIRTDFEGNTLWSKSYDHRPGSQFANFTTRALDNGYIMAGYYIGINNLDLFGQAYILKLDENGDLYSNAVAGRIMLDNNSNCMIDSSEVGIKDWVILAEKPTATFSTISDANGEYLLMTDTGTYTITLYEPYEYWVPCEDEIEVVFEEPDQEELVNFTVEANVDCPGITVSQTVPVVRPCLSRPSYIYYCNYGTVTAEDAYIDIVYDEQLSPISSTLSWDSLGGNTYRFQLGDLAPFECGDFQVDLFLSCDAELGANYCIETHAYPDSLCADPPSSWNGAYIDVNAICANDSLYFQIENIGNGNMDMHSEYIIVEDIILLKRDSVELEVGESEFHTLAANGSTFTLIAEQVENVPDLSTPIVIVQGCGVNDDNEFSIGYANQFPLNDSAPYLDIDCPLSVNSFDPNDKQGFPIGYSEDHFIRPNTPIEYLIRFQNTGTDTAYQVILRDTLSPWLSRGTIELGARSHPYDFEMTNDGVLLFNFQNILLPDSAANQLASNGFVEFKITPKEETPLNTVITNSAAIYFDFNEPVITNETFHTIGDFDVEFIVGTTISPDDPQAKVTAFPNPFSQESTIQVSGSQSSNYTLEIFDIRGNLLRQEKHNSSSILFHRNMLPTGIYIYRLSSPSGFLNSGKIIIQ